MKKFVCGFVIGAMLFSVVGVCAATQFVAEKAGFKVFVNGNEFQGTTGEILVVEGRTYLPLRDMGNALNIPVEWNSEIGQVEVGTVPDAAANEATAVIEAASEPDPTPAPATQAPATEAPKQTETVGQKNAVSKAQSYLKHMAFSHDGLVRQLEFEGFSNAEAVYGADNCGADWNEQAAKKAESYLKHMSFSRDGLIKQLEFENFTSSQAIYGVEAVGY